MTAHKGSEAKTTDSGTVEVSYKPFQLAHDAYFADLTSAWNNLQRRVQDVNFGYLRTCYQMTQAQPPKDAEAYKTDWQQIQEKYQRDCRLASEESNPAKRLSDAYQKYKESIQKAMADLNLEALDPLSLACIANSLLTISQAAYQCSISGSSAAPVASNAK